MRWVFCVLGGCAGWVGGMDVYRPSRVLELPYQCNNLFVKTEIILQTGSSTVMH